MKNAKTYHVRRQSVKLTHVVLLFLVILQRVAADVQLLSQEREVALINGVQHEVDSATFLVSSEPGNSDPVDATYTIRGSGSNNGSVYTMHVRTKPPYRTYTRTLLGYIPQATHLLALEVCAGDAVSTNSTQQLRTVFGNLLDQFGPVVELAAEHTRPRSPIEMLRAVTKSPTQASVVGAVVYHLSKRTTPNLADSRNFALQAFNEGKLLAGGAALGGFAFALGGNPVIGGLAVAAVAIDLFMNLGGGGNDDTQKALKQLFADFNALQFKEEQFETAQTVINDQVQQQIGDLTDAIVGIQSEVDRNTQNIVTLGNEIVSIADYQSDFTSAVTKQFNNARTAISATVNATDAVKNMVLYLHEEVESQIQRVVRAVRGNALMQAQFNNDIIRVVKEIDMKRVLTRTYFDVLDGTVYPYANMVPLSQNLGMRPMSFAARQALRRKDQAALVAEVRLSYTEQATNVSLAVGHTDHVGLVCDREWMLNSTTAINDVYSMLNMIGPNGNGTADDCECCNSFDANGAWRCHCVIRVRETSCQLQHLSQPWPWGYDSTHNCVDLANCPTKYTDPDKICANSITDTKTLGTMKYFTNMTQFNAWYSPVCRSSQLATSTGGYRMRISQTNGPNYIEMELDDQATQCNHDFVTVDSTPNIVAHEYPIWVMFEFWKVIFNGVIASVFGTWERELFGQLPSDTKTVKHSVNSYPNMTTCYTSATLSLALATGGSTGKVPVYVMEPGDLVHDVQVKFGDDGTFTQMGGTTGTTSLPLPSGFDGGVGNVTLTLASLFSSTKDGALPKSSFITVGNHTGLWYNEQGVQQPPPYTIASPTEGWDRGDAYNQRYIYDLPFSQLPRGRTSYSKAGTVMYLLEPVLWGANANTTGMDATQFRYNTRLHFDPESAAESAHRYLRQGLYSHDDQTYKCDRTFNYTDYGVNSLFDPEYTPEKNEWCTILDNFRVIESYDRSTMRFEYLEWSMLIKLRVPAGTFTSVIQTACPGAYRVDNQTITYAEVTLYANSTTPIQWDVQVCNWNTGSCTINAYSAYTGSPKVVVVSTPGNYSVQVYPLDQLNAPCFPGIGLPLGFDHQGHGSANMPYNEEQHVVYYTDDGMLDAIEQNLKIQDYANQIVVKEREYQEAQDAAAKARIDNEINRLIDEARNDTARIGIAPELEARAKRIAEQAQKTLEGTRESAAKNHAVSLSINASLTEVRELSKTIKNETNYQRQLIEDQKQIMKKIIQDENNVINSLDKQKCKSDIPVLGPILCGISDMLNGLLGGFGDFLAFLIHVALLLLLLYVAFKLIMMCVDHGCCKRKSATQTSRVDVEMHGAAPSTGMVTARDQAPLIPKPRHEIGGR